MERQIIEGQELLVDQYEDFEEKDTPSEDIAALHFQRIQAIPILTDAEERDLLQRWCEFKDEKARERLVESHLRMVPPIARNAAYKAGFLPNYEAMPGGGVKWTAALGFNEVVSDLTAAGNLGLMLAVDGYRLGNNVKFYTYARTVRAGERFGSRPHSCAARLDARMAVRRNGMSPLILLCRMFITYTTT